MLSSPHSVVFVVHVDCCQSRGGDAQVELGTAIFHELTLQICCRFPSEMDLEKLKRDLKEYGQEHVLKYWDELDEEQQARFYDDIRSIDLAKTNRSFSTTMAAAENHKGEKKDERIKPIPPDQIGSIPRAGDNLQVWEDRGIQEISEGKVAVLLLAGGQGTRLGVSYPKGMYNVGLPSGKTLYQLQAERIVKLQELAFERSGKKCVIPW